MKYGMIVLSLFMILACNNRKNYAPVIVSLTASSLKIAPDSSVNIAVEVYDENVDELIYLWHASKGNLTVNEPTSVTWVAPSDTGNETISVKVIDDIGLYTNGQAAIRVDTASGFYDSFESYLVHEYPSANGWYMLWGGSGAWVDAEAAFYGSKGFVLSGFSGWVRADGIYLRDTFPQWNTLKYEVAVKIPAFSDVGAEFGFFMYTAGNESRCVNNVTFVRSNREVVVKGTAAQATGFIWETDHWYQVRVELDYVNSLMDVYINSQQVINDLAAAPKDTTDIFSLGTEWGHTGVVYYDEVKITK